MYEEIPLNLPSTKLLRVGDDACCTGSRLTFPPSPEYLGVSRPQGERSSRASHSATRCLPPSRTGARPGRRNRWGGGQGTPRLPSPHLHCRTICLPAAPSPAPRPEVFLPGFAPPAATEGLPRVVVGLGWQTFCPNGPGWQLRPPFLFNITAAAPSSLGHATLSGGGAVRRSPALIPAAGAAPFRSAPHRREGGRLRRALLLLSLPPPPPSQEEKDGPGQGAPSDHGGEVQ